MSKDYGGPAIQTGGMTLLDYFAAASVHAAVVKVAHNFLREMGPEVTISADDIAHCAYSIAEEMLKQKRAIEDPSYKGPIL